MGTQIIEYAYSGDEKIWRQTIEAFLEQVAADSDVRDGFTYQVFVRDDGVTRLHVPVWRNQTILEQLQSRPYFSEFAAAIKEFAGDTLKITKPLLETAG